MLLWARSFLGRSVHLMSRRHFLIVAALAGSAVTAVAPSSSHAQGRPVKIGLCGRAIDEANAASSPLDVCKAYRPLDQPALGLNFA
ncbi:MAG: hypothetical protein ACOVVK_08200 [Elsteraceae bacterium]